MKKLLSVCLILVMVMSFNLTAFAKGGFVNSPSENLAPEIVDSSDDGIEIHAYADRHELTEQERKALEEAYDTIKGSTNLADLNSMLSEIAKKQNVNPEDLSVSDLFNLGYKGDNPEGPHSITLSADTLKSFVALMVYINGKWQIVDNAKIQNGNLVFNTSEYGPYAFVVNNAGGVISPQTGVNENAQSGSNNTDVIFYAVIMLASAGAALVLYRKSKKHTA